jgi:CDP-diacylglycerol--serine O-phosphatidyltransferase
MKRHIPNFITSLNLTSGFIALIFAFNGYIVAAAWLIVAAMVFDFLDGFSARLLKAYSDIGREFDSLADIVSFGTAPAVIIYQLIGSSLSLSDPMLRNADRPGTYILLMIPVIMPVFAGLRLAIFNVDTDQKTTFRGLPTPANALAVISLVIANHYSESRIVDTLAGSETFLIILTIVLSILMITRIPLLSLKTTSLKIRGNEGRYMLVILIIMSIVLFGAGGILLIIPLYLAASLIDMAFRRFTASEKG